GAKVGVRRYVCGTYLVQGRAGCANNWMREDELIPLVFDAVRQALSNPEGIRHARRELEAEAEECHRAGAGFAQALRHRADQLAPKVVGARDRMALAPADLVEDMARSVRGWKEERERLLAEARQLEEAEARALDARRQVEDAMAELQQLGEW